MRFLSVCSGIEAASVAWCPLGWRAVAFSEIEKFPCSLLAHYYPDVPNWGDMTKWEDWPDEAVDVLVGGTPCQSFSVAGERGGMDDPRGQLAWAYVGIARKYRPRWIVWENVQGVLSSGGGRDFGGFVQALVECGYSCAWRVLDAQWWGLAQRRKRVFLVGSLGGWRGPSAVLFDGESGKRNVKEVGEKGRETSSGNHGCPESILYAPIKANALTTTTGDYSRQDVYNFTMTVHAFYPSQMRLTGGADLMDKSRTLTGQSKGGGTEAHVVGGGMRIRRLTPIECERLMGFKDDYTNIPGSKDGYRYKALGNSMPVPVMKWIGKRIQIVEGLK